jgi:hypothetical protein
MLYDLTYTQAVAKAEHLKALGETTVYLDGDAVDLPWDKAVRVEKGCGYRLNGPTGFYVIAEDSGLTMRWSVDMEGRDANGASVTIFDRDRLREVAMKLPKHVRRSLAAFLTKHVLPEVEKRTKEWREYLNRQTDSEDCVRGLIAFANSN